MRMTGYIRIIQDIFCIATQKSLVIHLFYFI